MSAHLRHDHTRCGGFHVESEGAGGGRPFAFSSSPRHFERDRPFAIEHLALELSLDFPTKSVQGLARLTYRRVDPEAKVLVLDAVGFELEMVTCGGKPVEYTYDGHLLYLEVGRVAQSGTVEIRYKATPRKGLYFLEPDEHVSTRPRQAWTQFQEEDARHVFPCHDKPHSKMTTEVYVNVPVSYSVLSNGVLASETVRGERSVFHWQMSEPHPSYLMTIVAGEFAVLRESADVSDGGDAREVPISYWVPKGREEDARRALGNTPSMLRHFSKLTGVAYPWTKYAQVVVSDFFFGGMENTTASTLYEHVLFDERAALDVTSDDLVAHELAHQWFGDYITCRDWSEGWLNEGFATFFEHLWREEHRGRDDYEYGLRADLAAYLAEAKGRYRRPIVCQDYDAPLDLFDRHLYEKGGLVLHMLRTDLGDALFFAGVRTYMQRHAKGIVETRDLMRALEDVSGRSLGRRFEEMVYRPGHPEVDIDILWDDGILRCNAKQTQSSQDGVPSAFEVTLTLDIVGAGGARSEKFTMTARTDTFVLACPARPAFVVVDPAMRVLGEVRVRAPVDMLQRQLADAATARGRWLAAQALAHSNDPVTIEALGVRVRDPQEFWGVRVQAAEALGEIRARECFDVLKQALSVEHPKVRRAVAEALGRFRTVAASEVLKPAALKDASYLVEAEAARALGRTRQTSAFEVLVDMMGRSSWADVVAAGAIDGLAALRDDRALPHLYSKTRYGNAPRVRRAAALAIPKIASDRRAREHLEELLDDPDPTVRMDVVRALADLGDNRSRSALRARIEVDLDPRVRRRMREVVRDLGTERKQSDQLKEEVETMRTEQTELKTRLATLEALVKPQKGPSKKPTKKRAAPVARKRR